MYEKAKESEDARERERERERGVRMWKKDEKQ